MIDEHDPVIDSPGVDRAGRAPAVSLPVLIQAGEYQARSVTLTRRRMWGRPVTILALELIGAGPHDGLHVPWFATSLPTKGQIPASSKLWRAICTTLNRRPSRHDHISERLLLFHLYRVRVVTVTKDHAGHALPKAAQYSIVSDLLERLA
jgi:hypothetical protein